MLAFYMFRCKPPNYQFCAYRKVVGNTMVATYRKKLSEENAEK